MSQQLDKLDANIQDIIRSLVDGGIAHSLNLHTQLEPMTETQAKEHEKIRAALFHQTRAALIDKDTKKRRNIIETSLLESLKFPMMRHRVQGIERHIKILSSGYSWIPRPYTGHGTATEIAKGPNNHQSSRRCRHLQHREPRNDCWRRLKSTFSVPGHKGSSFVGVLGESRAGE